MVSKKIRKSKADDWDKQAQLRKERETKKGIS